MRRLRVSDDGHHLVTEDGDPFFWLADTAWRLLHGTTREEADLYLADRASKGFTVIQTLLMLEPDGLTAPNRYGHLVLRDMDPATPNGAHFEYVDYVVEKAESLGLYVALAPAWASGFLPDRGKPPDEPGPNRFGVPMIFNAGNARAYGEYMGTRYKDRMMIWIVGGDRSPIGYEDIFRAMAEGLAAGHEGRHLTTWHGGDPQAGRGSSPFFHHEPWLDLNMAYSGHAWGRSTYEQIARDRALTPPKPTFDGEPAYENHPLLGDGSGFYSNRRLWDGVTRTTGHQVRTGAYWAVLAGAAGHTFGCNDVWQFYEPGPAPEPDAHPLMPPYTGKMPPYAHPVLPWRVALHLPGARQMGMMRRLFESRPWQTMVPDQSVVVAGQLGGGEDHVQAAQAEDGSFLFAYLPTGTPVTIDMTRMSGTTVRAHWFDPRTGRWTAIAEYGTTGMQTFTPPKSGRIWDWLLVLDDAAKSYPIADLS